MTALVLPARAGIVRPRGGLLVPSRLRLTVAHPRLAEAIRGLIHAAVTHAAALRTILADEVDDYINTAGAQPNALLLLRDATVNVYSFTLKNPAFGAASGPTIDLDLPLAQNEEQAITDGDLDNFQIIDTNSAVALSGSVTGPSLGGDIEVSNISVNTDQPGRIDSLSYTAPA